MRMQLMRSILLLSIAFSTLRVSASQGGTTGAPSPQVPASAATQGRLTLTSSAFSDYGALPLKYAPNSAAVVTFDATSPPLAWTNPPARTVSFVLTMTDMESSMGDNPQDVLLWMVVNIPNNATSRLLAEGVPRGRTSMLPEGAFHRSFLTNGYLGPQPGANLHSHHYLFELYALDTILDLPRDVTLDQLRTAMKGHQTGRAPLVATCCVASK